MILVPKTEGPAHSGMGPSSKARVIACPPSVLLSKGQPDISSEYADQGTAAHHLAALCLRQGEEPWMYAGQVIQIEETGREFPVDEEMVLGVSMYLEECLRFAGPENSMALQLIEERIAAPDLHPAAFGTLDYGEIVSIRSEGLTVLRVVDLKYGFITVDAPWNAQAMDYAAYLWHRVGEDYSDVTHVEMVIVQPRAMHPEGPVRRWRTTVSQLGEWLHTVSLPAMRAADAPHSDPVPGPHCRYCPAILRCPAVTTWRDALILEAEMLDLRKATPDELGTTLNKLEVVKRYDKRAREEAVARGMRGEPTTGYKMVRADTHRTWKADGEAAIKEKLGARAYEQKLKSPAKIGKLAGGSGLVAEWAYFPEGGLTLVDSSDKRDEVVIQPTDPNETFSSLIEP